MGSDKSALIKFQEFLSDHEDIIFSRSRAKIYGLSNVTLALKYTIERYLCDQNRNTEARSLTFVASSVVIIFMRVR